jgi:hypothetical protein
MPALQFAEFVGDSQQITRTMRVAHVLCEHHNDIATGSFDRGLDRQNRTHLVLFAIRC